MLNFTCTTLACVQQFLGAGHIVTSTPNSLVFTNYNQTYYCYVQSSVYRCSMAPSTPQGRHQSGFFDW